MHEMALCEGLVQALEAQAGAAAFSRVHAVELEIGALAAVECEAMRFNFGIVTRGTLAEDARLDIVEVDGRAWCMQCATTVTLRRFGDPCPHCGSLQLQVLDGKQIRIRQIEVT